ncbi:GNAT family N-acetyltransferase [Lederbergia lenta]|uniref:GCN5-like N-acetyltransferase n=1 Tax=Lederbergia lenta TaxID=1467 RepID=A0A2X4X0A7_LEDLE|nr:GNAT family N-acetyltransferase [Lederbergia lenta]MCM3112246.1 GNAT family N-acetyltransferase [Lederbergia lenta]MEC2323414.1 GNAT family N-acetyltransferase [Lederbergia lenta]SQI63380.1 GCN5-like N-acetyltransferase [Lederbergia lenta]
MKVTPIDKERITDMVKLWNKEIGQHFPMREELFEQNSMDDENVLESGSGIALNQNDEVIGFVVSKRWQEDIDVKMNKETGWIQVLIVDSEYRRQGVGVALLEKAENALKLAGVVKITFGSDPWHYFPGLPSGFEDTIRWFGKQGYKKDMETYDLIAHYEDEIESEMPEQKEVEFMMLKAEEKDQFIDFMHRTFPGRWEYEAIQYFKKGGTGREFVVLKRKGEIFGFCRINDIHSPFIAQNVYWSPLFNTPLGGIGPLGVDPSIRGNGYGLAIVEAGVHFLRNRGIHSIIIDWTEFIDFYEKLGYEAWQKYESYSKEL